jgi:hypothetical protein
MMRASPCRWEADERGCHGPLGQEGEDRGNAALLHPSVMLLAQSGKSQGSGDRELVKKSIRPPKNLVFGAARGGVLPYLDIFSQAQRPRPPGVSPPQVRRDRMSLLSGLCDSPTQGCLLLAPCNRHDYTMPDAATARRRFQVSQARSIRRGSVGALCLVARMSQLDRFQLAHRAGGPISKTGCSRP